MSSAPLCNGMSSLDSQTTSRETRELARGTISHQATPVLTANLVGSVSVSHVTSQTTILKIYHVIGLENYGIWGYRMQNVLKRDGLYYCITAPSDPMPEEKRIRQLAQNALKSSVKDGTTLKLLRQYWKSYDCWTSLKSCYESDNNPR